MSPSYAARLSPLAAETVWSLEDGALIEQRGKTRAVHPLSAFSRMTLIPAHARRPHPSAVLRFGRRRLPIPAAAFGPRGVVAQPAAFSAFVRVLAAQARAAAPDARFVLLDGEDRRSPLIWAIALLAAGALGMLLTSIGSVTGGLGLSLAARLVFVALLLAAALPWLRARDQGFDPLAIPRGVLPA